MYVCFSSKNSISMISNIRSLLQYLFSDGIIIIIRLHRLPVPCLGTYNTQNKTSDINISKIKHNALG